MAQNQRRRLECLEQMGKLNRQHRFGGRQRNEIDFRFEHDAERAFRSDHQLREVERPICLDELVEVVPTDSTKHFRKTPIDLAGVLARKAPDHLVAPSFKAVARAFRLELLKGQRPELRDRAVREHDFLLEHVVDRLAVEHGACAA